MRYQGEFAMKTFACAALAASLILSAHTASAAEGRVRFGDLDLGTAAGASAFDARVHKAARRLCRDARRTGSQISDASACRAAVRDQALSGLPAAAQAEYAHARTVEA
jgi:UrcA family protein